MKISADEGCIRVSLELFDVFRRGEAGDPFELSVEIGDVVVSAFVADLRDGQFSGEQEFTGVSDAQLADVLERGFSGLLLEIAAECAGIHSGGPCDFVETYFAGIFSVEFSQYLIYSGFAVGGKFEVDAVVVEFPFVGGAAHHGEDMDAGEQPIEPFFLGELFDMVSDRGVRSGVETDPVSGHLQQLLDF